MKVNLSPRQLPLNDYEIGDTIIRKTVAALPEHIAEADITAAMDEQNRAFIKRSEEICARCGGTGLVTISYGGSCAALADADDQPCPDCTDLE